MKKFNNSPKYVTAFYFTYSIFVNCRYLTNNDYNDYMHLHSCL